MDTRTGRIYAADEIKTDDEVVASFLVEMSEPPTARQTKRKPPRVGMYEPCPCGSGKKFKWCCHTR